MYPPSLFLRNGEFPNLIEYYKSGLIRFCRMVNFIMKENWKLTVGKSLYFKKLSVVVKVNFRVNYLLVMIYCGKLSAGV